MTTTPAVDVDALAQEIRRIDGSHSLGAGAFAEALAPYIAKLATHPGVSREWQPIAEASNLPPDATGCSGPCAVLLPIDVTRGGPFIRQGHYDRCAGAFICHATGQALHTAVAFIRPQWPAAPSGGVA